MSSYISGHHRYFDTLSMFFSGRFITASLKATGTASLVDCRPVYSSPLRTSNSIACWCMAPSTRSLFGLLFWFHVSFCPARQPPKCVKQTESYPLFIVRPAISPDFLALPAAYVLSFLRVGSPVVLDPEAALRVPPLHSLSIYFNNVFLKFLDWFFRSVLVVVRGFFS